MILLNCFKKPPAFNLGNKQPPGSKKHLIPLLETFAEVQIHI